MKTIILSALIALACPAFAVLADDAKPAPAPAPEAPAATQPAAGERKLVTSAQDILKDVPEELKPNKEITGSKEKARAEKLREWCKAHAGDYNVKFTGDLFHAGTSGTKTGPKTYGIVLRKTIEKRIFEVGSRVTEAQGKQAIEMRDDKKQVSASMLGKVTTLWIEYRANDMEFVKVLLEDGSKVEIH